MKMKNKKAEEAEKRRLHKERQKKNRRKGTSLERVSKSVINKRKTILIVSDGENTEPSYFEKFKIPTLKIATLGTGYNTITTVEAAIEEKSEEYDEIWCCFDKDDFSDKDFNQAIELANRNGINVACSNQAFEYWFILHFEDHQGGAIHRNDYNKKINGYINRYNCFYDGEGSKIVNEDFFELMLGLDKKTNKRRCDLAIARAKRNLKNQEDLTPAKRESSTVVYKLVEILLEYI